MTTREARVWLIDALRGVSGEPEAEARWMLKAVGAEPVLGGPTPEGAHKTLEGYIEQRKNGRPLQYILGEWDFYGLTFKVREGALIPRPETETLVQIALELQRERGLASALEIGAGSGCIAVAMAKFGGFKSITATDISPEALNVARENAELNGVRVEFQQGEWFAPVAGRAFDLIVSNPPYIPSAELAALQRELAFEPKLALDGGEDGLDAYRELASGLGGHLTANGVALFEVGYDQSDAVRALFKAKGFKARAHRDLYGIERIVEVNWALKC